MSTGLSPRSFSSRARLTFTCSGGDFSPTRRPAMSSRHRHSCAGAFCQLVPLELSEGRHHRQHRRSHGHGGGNSLGKRAEMDGSLRHPQSKNPTLGCHFHKTNARIRSWLHSEKRPVRKVPLVGGRPRAARYGYLPFSVAGGFRDPVKSIVLIPHGHQANAVLVLEGPGPCDQGAVPHAGFPDSPSRQALPGASLGMPPAGQVGTRGHACKQIALGLRN